MVAKRTQVLLQIGLIILVTTVAFYPSLKNGFTNWDDPELLLENDLVKGLSSGNLQKIFSRSYAGFGGYTPLVFMSYALEYHFFRLDPRIFHADNLILHVLNTVLIYLFIFLISRNTGVSFFTSLLFGVHPLHVEAVAWVQGRKDLLFSLFFLGALICYGLFLRKRDKGKVYYISSLLLFACSLFSKVTAVALPLVILLLEYFAGQKLDRRALRRSAPFFVLAAVFLVLAFTTMQPGPAGVPAPKQHLSYLQNLSLFFYAFIFYISKILLPVRLMARYSADIGHYPLDLFLNGAIFAVGGMLIYFAYRLKREFTTFGVAFFVLTLIPTLPFHFAGQPYADRYTYLPSAGILFIISILSLGILPEKWISRRVLRSGPAIFLGFAVLLLGARTRALSQIWQSGVSLWTNSLKISPQNAKAYLDRADAHIDAGEMDQALADLSAAEKIEPENPTIHNDRGLIYFRRAEYDRALNEYNRSLSLDPGFLLGYLNRAILWGRAREFDKAIQDLTAAIRIDPFSDRAYYYRGLAYKERGRLDLALADFEAAYRILPTESVRREIEILSAKKTPRDD